ncbi:MAG: hypothetical protein GC155_14145 [Alphaproteobacteria bacterium]|nr:hypothetical protein [Alphaproteobacteria bacterium]
MKVTGLVLACAGLALSAYAQPPESKSLVEHPPSSPPPPPAGLREPQVAQPEHPLVIAKGDFDGDGRPDSVERIPGAYSKSQRIQVRLAAHPKIPYFIFEGWPESQLDTMKFEVGRPGLYLLSKSFRTKAGERKTCYPYPTRMPNDVVVIEMPGRVGVMVKHWAASMGGFAGDSEPYATAAHPPECPEGLTR